MFSVTTVRPSFCATANISSSESARNSDLAATASTLCPRLLICSAITGEYISSRRSFKRALPALAPKLPAADLPLRDCGKSSRQPPLGSRRSSAPPCGLARGSMRPTRRWPRQPPRREARAFHRPDHLPYIGPTGQRRAPSGRTVPEDDAGMILHAQTLVDQPLRRARLRLTTATARRSSRSRTLVFIRMEKGLGASASAM